LIRHSDSARGNDLYGHGAIVRVPHRRAPATGVAHTLHRDYETRSNANLPKVGVDKYAADPSTEVLCAAYAVDDGLERQVVKFEVAVDFRTEEGDDVRCRLLGLFPIAGAAFPQDCSDDGGKSNGDGETQCGEVLGMTEAARRQMVG
jgi:hypothetical protein